jgi:hypothetical protein
MHKTRRFEAGGICDAAASERADSAMKKAKEQRFLSTRRAPLSIQRGCKFFPHFISPSRSAAGGVRSLVLSLLTLLKKLFIPVRHGRSHSLKASVNTFLMFAIRNGSHRSARAQRRFPDTHAIFFICVRRPIVVASNKNHRAGVAAFSSAFSEEFCVQLLKANLDDFFSRNCFNYCS